MENYLIGIDLGTTSCKAAVFTSSFNLIYKCSREYPIYFPQDKWVEQDSKDWWNAIVALIKEILSQKEIEAKKIIGIGIDSQGSVVLPIDKKGNTLRKSMLWMDRRAEKQCDWINKNINDSLYKINGNHNDPSNIAPKVMWIKENEPEVYKNTFKFLHANGFLVYRLTGKYSIDISEGGLTQLFNTRTGQWSSDLIKGCQLRIEKFPDIYNCFDIVGGITKKAAKLTGLLKGTPVMAGAMDAVASALGTGAINNGQLYIAAGTVTVAGASLNKPIYNPNLHIYHHAIPNTWITAGGVDYGGAGVKWFKELIGNFSYSEINKLVASSNPGSNGIIFLPYMVGQRAPLWNSNTKGVLFGLKPTTKKEDIFRALMEGNAFGINHVLKVMKDLNIKIEDIKMTGGCTKINIWPQIFSDILQKNIEIFNDIDVATLGSAMIASLGINLYSIKELSSRFLKGKKTVPLKKFKKIYERQFKLFEDLYNHLAGDFKPQEDF
jgi:xylulokinase